MYVGQKSGNQQWTVEAVRHAPGLGPGQWAVGRGRAGQGRAGTGPGQWAAGSGQDVGCLNNKLR